MVNKPSKIKKPYPFVPLQDGVVVHLALAYRHAVHGHLGDAVVVDESAPQHEDVEYLVGMQPDVALAGEPAFGDAQGVQDRAHDVQQAHENEPAEALLAHVVEPAFHDAVMNGGHDPAQAERHEDAGPERPPSRLRKLIPQTDHDARDAQSAHHRQIDHFRPEMAIKPVVQPRHEGTHDKERYSAVVQLRKQLPYKLRMTVDRVEHKGETQTDYGAGEKRPEHNLLLQLNLQAGPH